ncbi:MAG: UDP-N-acetylmuramoyl-L-alanine--D-glutamate ligase [Dehalococcoidia bacterium]|nr:UDP-N-acetylmuramoyl-L-alanine--D-glutamate ligase [Dehalococcoidia bacterium]
MLPVSFKNQHIAIFGLGIEGIDMLKFLSYEGAIITVIDQGPVKKIQKNIDEVDGYKFNLHIGQVKEKHLQNIKYAFISQGIPLNSEQIALVHQNNISISSMTDLFFDRCQSPIIGITGSSGKTTTTSIIKAILEESKIEHVIGGNIGIGMLGLLHKINKNTKVILELSHTQLQLLTKSPNISCITNITPNHLDQFSWNEYVQLKHKIMLFQKKNDHVVMNLDDENSQDFIKDANAQISYFSANHEIGDENGAFMDQDGFLTYKKNDELTKIIHRDEIILKGKHNISNALLAIIIAQMLGVKAQDCQKGISKFNGVEHRIETIAIKNNIEFINDSIATTPERTITALKSIDKKAILLMGGKDKNLEFGDLVMHIQEKCRFVILFGESRKKFLLQLESIDINIKEVTTLKEAVELACNIVRTGECILLSPGGTSFDEFENYEERGRFFKKIVKQIYKDWTKNE